VLVSWYDAVAYANWLSSRDGLTPAYTVTGTNVIWNRSANGWRLPTEAEWEYAARGGRSSRNTTYAGSDDFGSVAWYDRNSGSKTQPVAGKQANELGLYDLSGNVWEWCWDWYGAYPNRAETNPGGPASGTHRVLRGGSWISYATSTRVAYRIRSDPGNRNFSLGFPLVRLGSPNR
jgi:formylglycine-generating enzyme